jgi:ABC-2 type transport system ATP-binding protein
VSKEAAAVVAEGLVKTFQLASRLDLLRGRSAVVRALDGVNLRVGRGECFGLLGPNGAGKTTLIKILTTLLIPDSGRAWVNGLDVAVEPENVLQGIGVMLTGERTLYWKLTGRENLEFFGRIHGVPEGKLRERVGDITQEFELHPFVDRMVETYSTGQRIILSFCKSLVADAPTIFLDEPTISLDPNYASRLRDAIVNLTKVRGKTVLLTTQLMQEADLLCDRVAMLCNGKVVATGTPSELKGAVKMDRIIRLRVAPRAAPVEDIRKVVNEPGASVTELSGGAYQIEVTTESAEGLLPFLVDRLTTNGFQLLHVHISEPTLEDAFKVFTSGGDSGG